MDPTAPTAPNESYPLVGNAPYPTNSDQGIYPTDTRPVYGMGAPQLIQPYSNNVGSLPPQQPGLTRQVPNLPPQGFPGQQRGYPPQGPGFPPQQQQMMGYQPQPGYPPQNRGFPGYPQPAPGYQQHAPGYPPQAGGYPQPQGYHQPGLYTGSQGNTDMAAAAGMGALAGLAGAYFADSTPTMGEMAIGAGVGGAIGLAGSAATSGGAMSALGLAGHDMGDRNARRAARYGIPIAAMGAGFLTNKAFDRGSGYNSE